MSLKNQRRIAAQILKCSPHRVRFDPDKLNEIKEVITKLDMRKLISDGTITEKAVTSISRGRAKALLKKKQKGKHRGKGSRKGSPNARSGDLWMNRIRSQRKLLADLRDKGKIDQKTFRMLYMRSKGGFFRNVRHIMLYLQDQQLMKK